MKFKKDQLIRLVPTRPPVYATVISVVAYNDKEDLYTYRVKLKTGACVNVAEYCMRALSVKDYDGYNISTWEACVWKPENIK